MNYKERLARLGLYNSEARIVELSSLLRHGDTELGAQGNNSLSELFDRLAGKSAMKDLEVKLYLRVLRLTLNPCVGFECRDR